MVYSASTLITFGLLAASIVALWAPQIKLAQYRVHAWVPVFAASVVSGFIGGILAWQAIASLSAFGMLAKAARELPVGRLIRGILMVFTGWMALALSMHLFPGFSNPSLVVGARFSPTGIPFTHHANFDTTSAGLILMAVYCNPQRTEWRRVLTKTYPIIALTVAAVFGFALLVGYVAFYLKLAPYTALFLTTNLLFTCVTEEAFFRGFMQEQLTQFFPQRPRCAYMALVVAALLFGVAHGHGGPVLVALAAIAGMGYGYAYLATRRIEASILTHFAVNAVHFVFFTYPNL
jgi:membrane protease YdiL (CAAX protease family)